MPMKRTELIVCAALLLLSAAGCRKDNGDTEVNAPIRFSGVGITKSLVGSEQDMRAVGLKLYGWEGSDAIFDGRDLTWSSTSWSYSGKTEWWVPGKSYDFLGLYPRTLTAARTNKTISFSHTISDYHYQQQNDLLAGYHTRNYVKGGDASAVDLPMKHLLSQITFKVVNASDAGTLDVSGASITGLYASGTCTITIPGGSYSVVWTPSGDRISSAGKYAGDKSVTALPIGEENMAVLYQEPLLVIPQAVNSEDMKLNLTVTPSGSTPYNKSVSLRAATGITAWEPGKKYTYIASITSNIITFSVTVNDWLEDDEYEIK